MKKFIKGLNHLGLIVEDITAAKRWFIDCLGMTVIEDRGELVFLSAGSDILAIKTPHMAVSKPEHGLENASAFSHRSGWQTLDHYGFFAPDPKSVDDFAVYIQDFGAKILKGPYDRRDGRAVYFKDPLGIVGEYLYFQHPDSIP